MEGVSEDVAKELLLKQNRCVECGSSSRLEIHHRIFRSEYTEAYMVDFLYERVQAYHERLCTRFQVIPDSWGLHDMKNLVVLCSSCHQRIHSGDSALRNKYRESFTEPNSGFNVPYRLGCRSLY